MDKVQKNEGFAQSEAVASGLCAACQASQERTAPSKEKA
jgi:hypothetical protein